MITKYAWISAKSGIVLNISFKGNIKEILFNKNGNTRFKDVRRSASYTM